MATRSAARAKSTKPAPRSRKAPSYARLLKLSGKSKPPQRWYDEAANPFEPEKPPKHPGAPTADRAKSLAEELGQPVRQ